MTDLEICSNKLRLHVLFMAIFNCRCQICLAHTYKHFCKRNTANIKIFNLKCFSHTQVLHINHFLLYKTTFLCFVKIKGAFYNTDHCNTTAKQTVFKFVELNVGFTISNNSCIIVPSATPVHFSTSVTFHGQIKVLFVHSQKLVCFVK